MSNQNDKWRKFDIVWMLNLFGTAVWPGLKRLRHVDIANP